MTIRIQPDILRRSASFGVSVGIHVLLVTAMLSVSWPPAGSSVRNPRPRPNGERVDAEKYSKVIWLPKGQSLPRISPAPAPQTSNTAEPRPGSLYIRTEPPKPKYQDQFIQVPDPITLDQAALPSPNVVMGGAALPPPPKPVERRRFVPPPERPKAAPAVRIDEPDPALATGLSGLPVEAAALENPSLIVNRGDLGRLPKPPAKKMVAPAIGGERTASVGTLEAPALEGGAGQAGLPGQISAIILSGNPVPDGKLVQPAGNRPAAITAGSASEAGPGNGGSAGGGMVVPGVTVRDSSGGAPAGTSGAAAAAPAATPTPTRMPYRPRLDTPSVSIAQWPSNRRVPPEVELNFSGRPVYSTVVPGAGEAPDINVWFGEKQQGPVAARVIMRPPVLDSSGGGRLLSAAWAGKYWLKAKLTKEGSLTALEVIHGPQDAQLAKVLESWQWKPAIRNGQAVDVDVVLEVVVRASK